MKVIGIIPARYDSTRFPGKPLVDIAGMTMIQRVYNQVKHAASLNEVVVATDDQRIFDHVKSFAGNVVMTSKDHQSGTDRCAEVINNISGFDIAINIQGDEPFIDPQQIDLLVSCFQRPEVEIATLVRPINELADLENVNKPKVVLNQKNEALYFSRQPIPYMRGTDIKEWLSKETYYNHIGIYGFKVETLKDLAKLPISKLEKTESLEQLRWLDNGYRIQTAISNHINDAIDSPEDLQDILKKYFSK
ncbi:3-deoxy-manno-octulosonate cytidylyltransferase [Sphingobacterium mizutaii NBRC 14946 = DSM 11724]|uniref:3-deoxy-manno-octulosonate cytidylyltransferase n=2 Tax=Sphingobacterium mizutaii TaxID=1010 RepID=A0AAJ4XBE2_9SPHI|nr:3-deoxy-manno-octulosonate cytidylyltransferase [Sphingobacterium mizutaii]GEM68945.1 3-deoxy-manno-octulosonate cytidylyltransferase [Sphingobacterium mizutaii NBRC 14946 = DSM 11724]SDL02631.1 3-deoxy-manno-octulosonate cytidylyltransferase (CMP-KDO synthetase) [Sphingobacterium mizutaii]SNV50339.1 3-deoxy-manno-octulosonate cytidylyltransferase [Sphingobacterium mizutaii]